MPTIRTIFVCFMLACLICCGCATTPWDAAWEVMESRPCVYYTVAFLDALRLLGYEAEGVLYWIDGNPNKAHSIARMEYKDEIAYIEPQGCYRVELTEVELDSVLLFNPKLNMRYGPLAAYAQEGEQ